MQFTIKQHPMLTGALVATGAAALAALAALVSGCSTSPTQSAAPGHAIVTPGSQEAAPGSVSIPADVAVSQAATPRAYRADAAAHIYAHYSQRIWKGKLPPLLRAVGVLQVEVDGRGNVKSMHWMRAPTHAPEAMAQIERMVRAASPFPAPVRMGRVTYTDVWLWHESGRFQLDTLTEGQL